MTKLLTVKQVSEILNTSASTIYQWVEEGKIPYCKLNGCLRFTEDEISAWITGCKRDPKEGYNNSIGRRPRKGGKV